MLDRKLVQCAQHFIKAAGSREPVAERRKLAHISVGSAVMAAQSDQVKTASVLRLVNLVDDMEKMATLIRLREYAVQSGT